MALSIIAKLGAHESPWCCFVCAGLSKLVRLETEYVEFELPQLPKEKGFVDLCRVSEGAAYPRA